MRRALNRLVYNAWAVSGLDTVSAFVTYLFPDADVVTGLLMVPSIIGEIWIMGYLIVVGVHDHAPSGEAAGKPCPVSLRRLQPR